MKKQIKRKNKTNPASNLEEEKFAGGDVMVSKRRDGLERTSTLCYFCNRFFVLREGSEKRIKKPRTTKSREQAARSSQLCTDGSLVDTGDDLYSMRVCMRNA